jgi:hypothetical protein
VSRAAQAVRPKVGTAAEPARRAPATKAAAPAATPRYLRPSLRLGGLNDPEEHEAEHAAGVIASGGCYRVRDPGGSQHLRAASDPPHATKTRTAAMPETPMRTAVAAPVTDPGAAGRVRRTVDLGGSHRLRAAAARVTDPGASGQVRRADSPAARVSDAHAAQRVERARGAAARPLPPMVRQRLEHGFGESLANVQVHSGPTARSAAAAISARAYTEGERITLGPGESEHDVRLMAHETTHVVQNRRAAGVARMLPEGEARPAATPAAPTEVRRDAAPARQGDVRRAEANAATPVTQPIRRFGIGYVLDKFADWANVIPGFRLLTIILGINPINMAAVDRSGANILRAAVELIPFGGLIVQALEKYGIFEKGGAWIDQQIATLGMIGSSLRDALMDFIDSLHLSDILHPGDVWDRAKRIFTEPIDRIIAFFKTLATGLIDLIKDAILKPLAALAATTRAWDLLIAVLGRNPITGEEVPRTAETLIGAFMKLAGKEEVWENIQKAHALQRCWAWFQKAMVALVGFVQEIPGLFIAALKSFAVADLLDLPGAIARVLGMFGNFAGRFISWAAGAVWDLAEIIIEAVSPGALTYIKKTGAALKSVLLNPLPFVRNLVRAARLGLANFADNFADHLKAALLDWLTGAMPGVYIPNAFSLLEFGKFALSVLGISWAQIRSKIVKALGPTGETIMKTLETAFDVVKALITGGPAAAWEVIKDKLTNLKDMVIDGIVGFVTDTVIKKAIPKLVSMFIPGAGFISAILSIYDTVMVFVNKLAQIAAAVTAFVDSIIAIAAGQIGAAAKRVESALQGILSLAISFLAGFLGLGNIAEKVMGVIGKVRAMVDKALDTAIAWIIGKAKALFARLFGGKDKKDERTEEQKAKDKLDAIAEAERLVPATGFDPAQVNGKLDPIKAHYRLLTLNLVVDAQDDQSETVHFTASASDEISGKPKKVQLAAGVGGPPLQTAAWIKNLKTGGFEQVGSAASVVKRGASGGTPLTFSTVTPEGGSSTYSYNREHSDWERTAFTHGSKLVMPVGGAGFSLKPPYRGREYIRDNLYGDSSSSRAGIVASKVPGLLDPADGTYFLSEAAASVEAAQGYTQKVNGRARVPVAVASPDHDPPVAAHWTSKQGNNVPQVARTGWNANLGTYKIMSLKANLSLGSRGARFTDSVGIAFRGPGET